MSERYQFESKDYPLLEAAAVLLRKVAAAETTEAAELVSIAKLQHILAALPRVTSDINVTVSVVSPCRKFEETETFHWWDISVDDECLSISSGGHFYRPTTGGDTFSTMRWTAIPERAAELEDFRDSLWMVPDVCSFPEGVANIDLSAPGFKVEVTDEDNPLLDEEEETEEQPGDEVGDEPGDDESDISEDDEQLLETGNTPICTEMEKNFNERAFELMSDGRQDEAQLLLEDAVREMPVGWRPFRETDSSLDIAFWDLAEFFAYTKQVKSGPLQKSVMWISGSYSQAWYILGALASQQDRLEHALFCLDCGLELEPDHPEHWSEKGFVLGKLKRHQEALRMLRSSGNGSRVGSSSAGCSGTARTRRAANRPETAR